MGFYRWIVEGRLGERQEEEENEGDGAEGILDP